MQRLSDAQWELIRGHFPEKNLPERRAGRKPVPTRDVLDAVLWILNTSAQALSLSADSAGMLVKSDVARRQMDAEVPPVSPPGQSPGVPPGKPGEPSTATPPTKAAPLPRRFHATVQIDPHRAGRDAGKIADEVLTHLVGLVGSDATVTIEIEASFRDGAPENVVRTVSENCRTLKFKSFGFEKE